MPDRRISRLTICLSLLLSASLLAQGGRGGQFPGGTNPDGSLRPSAPVSRLFTQDAYTEYAILEPGSESFRIRFLPEETRTGATELVNATTGGAVPGVEPEADAVPEDPRLDAAEEALERGDLAAAEAAYRSILDAEPDHPEAGLALRQVQLFRRAEEAGPDALARADAAPEDVAAQTRAADFLLGTGNIEAAFDRLLDVVRRSAGEDRDQARKHLVELFAVVGDDDPRVGTARRQLTAALF